MNEMSPSFNLMNPENLVNPENPDYDKRH